ncbi:MAG: LysR family transcriptional regulator [Burkholderiales bacterium]|nr:LysR family transcriptional regulator [Burkholderiales bacterium]
MHTTLRQLKVFEAVARLGSFTRAAEALFLSQSTVSTQMKQLAETIGQTLFTQTGKRIVLTEIGEALYATCIEMADAWSRFEAVTAELRELRRGRVQVAAVSAAESVMALLSSAFRERHPGLDLQLTFHPRQTVIERLAEDLDDLYVMGWPPEGFDLVIHPFRENPLVPVAGRDHPLARGPRIALARFAEQPVFVRERGSGARHVVERHFREHGLDAIDWKEADSDAAIRQAITAGSGVAVLPRDALGTDPSAAGIAVLDVEDFPIPGRWSVIHPGGRLLSPAARAFVDQLQGFTPEPTADVQSSAPIR